MSDALFALLYTNQDGLIGSRNFDGANQDCNWYNAGDFGVFDYPGTSSGASLAWWRGACDANAFVNAPCSDITTQGGTLACDNPMCQHNGSDPLAMWPSDPSLPEVFAPPVSLSEAAFARSVIFSGMPRIRALTLDRQPVVKGQPLNDKPAHVTEFFWNPLPNLLWHALVPDIPRVRPHNVQNYTVPASLQATQLECGAGGSRAGAYLWKNISDAEPETALDQLRVDDYIYRLAASYTYPQWVAEGYPDAYPDKKFINLGAGSCGTPWVTPVRDPPNPFRISWGLCTVTLKEVAGEKQWCWASAGAESHGVEWPAQSCGVDIIRAGILTVTRWDSTPTATYGQFSTSNPHDITPTRMTDTTLHYGNRDPTIPLSEDIPTGLGIEVCIKEPPSSERRFGFGGMGTQGNMVMTSVGVGGGGGTMSFTAAPTPSPYAQWECYETYQPDDPTCQPTSPPCCPGTCVPVIGFSNTCMGRMCLLHDTNSYAEEGTYDCGKCNSQCVAPTPAPTTAAPTRTVQDSVVCEESSNPASDFVPLPQLRQRDPDFVRLPAQHGAGFTGTPSWCGTQLKVFADTNASCYEAGGHWFCPPSSIHTVYSGIAPPTTTQASADPWRSGASGVMLRWKRKRGVPDGPRWRVGDCGHDGNDLCRPPVCV